MPDKKILISTDNSIRNKEAVVGIGNFTKDSRLCAGAIVYDALKNLQYFITPDVEYYVTFGNYEPGQIIDIDNIQTPFAKIPFAPNRLNFITTVRKDNTIVVRIDN